MDIKAKIKEIAERCEKDEEFRQLMKSDFAAAVESCGVSSVAEFAKELDESGLLDDQEMGNVAGGVSDDSYYGYGSRVDFFYSAYKDWQRVQSY